MVEFTEWGQALIFVLVFSVLIILPCLVVTQFGRKMIYELGHYPSRAAIIQMKSFWWMVATEILTFAALMGFYNFFQAK